jgi:hypothetical protein
MRATSANILSNGPTSGEILGGVGGSGGGLSGMR